MDYKTLLPLCIELEHIVGKMLSEHISKKDIPSLEIAHRIKSNESAAEKLRRKHQTYSDIAELTDLVGFRIICYFSDDVDKIASVVESLFDIDKENSVDKRKALSPTAFGYLSLHYICTLPKDSSFSYELKNLPFEIQIRSSLQHTWAEIEHDLGYKTEFAIPRDVRREFSRIAGLLELADESFSNIRLKLKKYTEQITTDIANGNVSDLTLDIVTLGAFLKYNSNIVALRNDIVALTKVAIYEQSPESYLQKLEVLGINTVDRLEDIAQKQYSFSLSLAKEFFKKTDLDEIASTAPLHFILRAELINGDYSYEKLVEFFSIGSKYSFAKHQADGIINKRNNINKKDEK